MWTTAGSTLVRTANVDARALKAIETRTLAFVLRLALAGSYSMLANILGYPAGVVPVTRVRVEEETQRRSSIDVVERAASGTEKGSAGLPVAVQIIARPWREPVAFALLSAIEASIPSRKDFTPPLPTP